MGGNSEPLISSALPARPWHPEHPLMNNLPPAIRFSSVGATGLGISGACRRTEACTAGFISRVSQTAGARSARTLAKPSRKYATPHKTKSNAPATTPSRKFFIFDSVVRTIQAGLCLFAESQSSRGASFLRGCYQSGYFARILSFREEVVLYFLW